MSDKMPVCCARWESKVTCAKADLANLARVASRRKDGPTPRMMVNIEQAKANVRMVEADATAHILDNSLEHR